MNHSNRYARLFTALLTIFLCMYTAYHLTGWAVSLVYGGEEPLATATAVRLSQAVPYASKETAAHLSVVVNRDHPLPETYVPDDLTAPDIPFIFAGEHEKRNLRAPAARAAEELFAAAKQDGIKLYGVSGFRSYETQKALFAFNVRNKGQSHASRYSAVPGASEHQTGLALDVTSESVKYELVPAFANTKEGRWLNQNAHKFGFIIRYAEGKEDLTGIAYEPWHIRYVGKKTALELFESGLSLEELANEAKSVYFRDI